ncbi:hypothetical protein C8J57DRAFT_1533452 [Mycena rebaudengoi]|nr:hypothetical protein C8J57DRAFT_1533452 [Mycena rebaudengoi]
MSFQHCYSPYPTGSTRGPSVSTQNQSQLHEANDALNICNSQNLLSTYDHIIDAWADLPHPLKVLANGKAIPATASSFPSIPGFIYPLFIIPPASTHRYLITAKAIQDYHINPLDDGTSSADEVEVDLGLTTLLQWTSSSQISSSDLGPASHHQLHRPPNSKAPMFPAFSAIVMFTQKALTATQKSMLHVQGDYLILTFWRKSGKMSEPGRTKKIRHFTPPFLPAPKSPPIPYFKHTTPDSSPIVKSAHFKNYVS